MKNARLATNDKPSAPNSLDFTTAQNLSKYSRKVLSRTMADASTAGFSVTTHHGQVFVISQYGLQKAFANVEAAQQWLGGAV